MTADAPMHRVETGASQSAGHFEGGTTSTSVTYPPAAGNGKASRAWRYRRCPACSRVDRAGAFAVAEVYRSGWQMGDMRRSCPACGHQATTSAFRVVRERHPAVRP